MPRIAILPSAVADQIAAGEVVERPASVVKELFENAIDAGAGAVDIAVTDGGRAEIRISDDGCGMGADDARLALERHATSKIRVAADLVGVQSFGFRGEALPAIASVSHLELLTSTGEGSGTSIRAAGGHIVDVADAPRRRGTTLTVARLFYNVPARQKFLRSARSEWRAIADTVTLLSLARLDLRVSLSHDGRDAIVLPAARTVRERMAALWGSGLAEALVSVDDVTGPVHVAGLVQRPGDVGTSARRALVLVNGRVVRDAGIIRAAETAYRSTLAPGLRPTVILHVTVSDDAVDVNVHPAKAEVRFRERWGVEQAVQRAVVRALGTFESAPGLTPRLWRSAALPADGGAGAAFSPVDLDALSWRPAPRDGELFSPPDQTGVESAVDAGREPPIPRLIQLRSTFLLVERGDGIVLIDQHSAHERILYEQFLATLKRSGHASQRLLFPLTLHLTPAEADAFESNRDLFELLGFEIEGFGGSTLIVRSVPLPHPRFDPERCLRETLASLSGDRHTADAPRHERLAATVACKAAIKAGDTLSPSEMEALYRGLTRTTLPAHDVHGRSTIVHLSWDEVERRFGRR